MKPEKLYHGSSRKIEGLLIPILNQDSPDHVHTRASVFGTDRVDLAALFMFSSPIRSIFSIGFEQGIAYICIWGSSAEDFMGGDHEGFIYVLPSETFEKVGKEYEWQSFEAVKPQEVKHYQSVIEGMIECAVQVYFINDDPTFDLIVTNKFNRAPILKNLVSENQKRNINVKIFN
ncbi:MAG TPA: hypothetical protein VJH71_02990 [Candidatus Paceibacterota bacterium]